MELDSITIDITRAILMNSQKQYNDDRSDMRVHGYRS